VIDLLPSQDLQAEQQAALRPLVCYENEDGDVWVPLEEEPDEATSGQRYADERGLAVVAEGVAPTLYRVFIRGPWPWASIAAEPVVVRMARSRSARPAWVLLTAGTEAGDAGTSVPGLL
jgi:hypothetical protein